MAKPSIFSRDYERKMKRRKRNITIVSVLVIILAVVLVVKFEVANTDFSDLKAKIQAWVDSDKPKEDDSSDDTKKNEDKEEKPVVEVPKNLSYDFTTANGSIVKAKYQEVNGSKVFQGIEAPQGVTYSMSPSMTKVIISDQNQNILLGNVDGTTKDLTKHTYTDKRGNNYNKDDILAKYPDNIWCSSIKFIDDNTLIYFSNLPYLGIGVQDKYFWTINTETLQEQMLTGLVGTNVSIGNLDLANGIEVSVNGYNYYIKADGSCVQKENIGSTSGAQQQQQNNVNEGQEEQGQQQQGQQLQR